MGDSVALGPPFVAPGCGGLKFRSPGKATEQEERLLAAWQSHRDIKRFDTGPAVLPCVSDLGMAVIAPCVDACRAWTQTPWMYGDRAPRSVSQSRAGAEGGLAPVGVGPP